MRSRLPDPPSSSPPDPGWHAPKPLPRSGEGPRRPVWPGRGRSAPPAAPGPRGGYPAPAPDAPTCRPTPAVAPTPGPSSRSPARARHSEPAGLSWPPSARSARCTRRLAASVVSPGSGSRPQPGTRSRSAARSGSSWARMKARWNSRPASCIAASMAPEPSIRPRVSTTRWWTTIRPSGSFSRTSSRSSGPSFLRRSFRLIGAAPSACRSAARPR